MTERIKRQFTYSLRQGATKYLGYVRLGTSGRVGGVSGRTSADDPTSSTPGFSVAKLYYGRYKVTFDEPVLGLIGFNYGIESDEFHSDGYLLNIDDTSNLTDKDSRFLTMRFNDAYGAEKAPINTTVFLEFTVKTKEKG